MSYSAEVLADSTELRGNRLTTFQLTFPRIILAEMNTHRVLSRNSASTRAIPITNQFKNLLENPFIPEKFGINQPGMQSYAHLDGLKRDEAERIWLDGRDRSLTTAAELQLGKTVMADIFSYNPTKNEYVSGDEFREKFEELKAAIPKSKDNIDLSETNILNVHKQLAGRGLEPYMWQTAIVTGTEWENLYALRDHKEAQGEIRTIVHMAREAMKNSTPTLLEPGQWHTPLVEPGEFDDPADAVVASVARTAAVSYNRHSNTSVFEREKQRHDSLVNAGHMSPTEHQGTPMTDEENYVRQKMRETIKDEAAQAGLGELAVKQLIDSTHFNGNVRGWTQYRKTILHEDNFGELQESA